MGNQIDWESLRPIFDDLYLNDADIEGRPNFDPVMMAKVLFIQGIYNLVDESLEREINNRIDFMHFWAFLMAHLIPGQSGCSVKDFHPLERTRSCGIPSGNSLRRMV